MSLFVLDTSVAIAWYLPDDAAAAARRWQTKLLRGDLTMHVPSLHFWEFGNVLRTYVRRGELDGSLAEDIFRLHLDAPLDVSEPERAAVLTRALSYQATVYDAVYIELTLMLDAKLLTLERSTTPWVKKLGSAIQRLG